MGKSIGQKMLTPFSPKKPQRRAIETSVCGGTTPPGEFERLLDLRNVSQALLPQLQTLDPNVKAALVRNEVLITPVKAKKRRRDEAVILLPAKRRKPTTLVSVNLDALGFAHYIQEHEPSTADVHTIKKLRLLLRNESIEWIREFIRHAGFAALCRLLAASINLQWREEHENDILLELIACLHGICTTEMGRIELRACADSLFPLLFDYLYSNMNTCEYRSRTNILRLLCQLVDVNEEDRADAVRQALTYIRHHRSLNNARLCFLQQVTSLRPYDKMVNEMRRVTKDVFWMFLYYDNKIEEFNIHGPITTQEEVPPPTAHVNGIECEAALYLSSYLRFLQMALEWTEPLNRRLALRRALKDSGLDTLIGSKFRKADKRLYPELHKEMQRWVTFEMQDGWSTKELHNTSKCQHSSAHGPAHVLSL